MPSADSSLQEAAVSAPGGLRGYVASLRAFDRNVKLFLTVTAFRGLTVATLGTVLNLYLYSLGYDAPFIGLMNGVNGIAVLIFSVPAGYLADRLGRHVVLLASGVAYPLSLLGLAFSTSTSALLIFNFLFGICAVGYWVAGVPLLFASTREENRVQAFSVNSFLLWGLGPLGALVSGQVVEGAGRVMHVSASNSGALRIGMFFMVGLALVGTVPYLFLRERGEVRRTSHDAPPRSHTVRLFSQLLLPDLVLMFGVGAILTFSQLYFHLRFGLTPGTIGLIMGVGGTMAGAATLFTPLVTRRWGNLNTTVRLAWLAVPMMAAMALSKQLGLAMLAFWFVVALRGMIDPAYTAFVQERVPEAYRARLTGLYSVTYSLGFSLGPVASGQLQKIGGFTPAFLMGTACYLTGAVLLYSFFGRSRRFSRKSARSVRG